MEENNQSFSYRYSAKEQEEVKRIRQKYVPSAENKLAELRRLDESATRPGRIVSIVVGVISSLVLGVGMCCTMVWTRFFVPGVFIGLVGIAGVCAAFPIYSALTNRQRRKLAPEIMALSRELMEEK